MQATRIVLLDEVPNKEQILTTKRKRQRRKKKKKYMVQY